MFLCGTLTYGQMKPCKYCRNFFLWGISTGHCDIHKTDKSCWEHCKYYKRDSELWFKDGRCKVNENELYI